MHIGIGQSEVCLTAFGVAYSKYLLKGIYNCVIASILYDEDYLQMATLKGSFTDETGSIFSPPPKKRRKKKKKEIRSWLKTWMVIYP